MKIAVVLDQYYTYDGGAHTFQGELLRALEFVAPESRHEFVVLSPEDLQIAPFRNFTWQRYAKPGLVERAILKFFRYFPNVEDSMRWQSSLERQADRIGAELAWFLSPRLRVMQMPFVPLVLDLQHRLQPQFPEVSAGGEWQTRERHYQRCLPNAKLIVAGTQAGRDEIVRFYGVDPEKILILPHPTPQAALNGVVQDDAQVLTDFGLQPGYLLYPAQLWMHKNHANLLLALAELKESGLTLQLVLTGSDFGARRSIQKLIKLHGLEKQVKFLDYVSRSDLYALYRNALALTYMSFFGPENLPPLEAFALRCPVIAARVSGAEEQLGTAAILVDPTDSMEIANAVRTLHSEPAERQRLIAEGHARAQVWTTRDFVRGALRAFDEIEQASL